MRYLRRPPLSVKLGLVLFAIVAGALVIVYLAVVPRLESRLVDAKIQELERSSPSVLGQLRRANQFEYAPLVSFFASGLNARVIVFQRLNDESLIVVADSSGLRAGDVRRDPVALAVARSGQAASGRVTRGGQERAEYAVPVDEGSILLLSASLADALANVRTVQRSLLLAGGVALVVSWLVGYLLAWRFSRRIRRLELAAERIAGGDFDVPVSDPGGDEVAELAEAFDRMRLRLAHLDRARREFIANASHELRTPLFSLGGFLELMADEDLEESVRRDFVAEMIAQVERLTKLATDLLDLSRLDAGQLSVEREELDLAASARTVAEEFRALAEAGGYFLSLDAPRATPALGDWQRVLQIGRILVENALRHTPPGTAIEVRAGERDGHAFLAVRDEGPGVPAGDREHLFERFYRAGGGAASGSGLGLAIASELAVRMDGAIELRSEPGETVFILLLSSPGAAFSREKAFPVVAG